MSSSELSDGGRPDSTTTEAQMSASYKRYLSLAPGPPGGDIRVRRAIALLQHGATEGLAGKGRFDAGRVGSGEPLGDAS